MNDVAKDYKFQGTALMGSSKYKEAQEMFKKALEVEEDADTLIDLGNAYASNGEYNEALNAFTRALMISPDNGELLFNIGSVYLLQERLTKCIEYYNKAEEAGFDNVRLYINLAAIYNALGDQQMELRNYTKAIDKNPLIADLYVKKAMLLIEMGQFEAALDIMEEMRKLFPDSFEGYDLAARVYLAKGNPQKALDMLDTGLAKFPNDINLRLSKLTVLIELQDIDASKKLLQEIKSNPYAQYYERDITMQEVTIASVENKPEVMKELLLKVVGMETEACDEQARFMLMMTCKLLEDYECAYEQASKLCEQDSKSEYAIAGIYYKGEFLKELGKVNEAQAEFKKAAKKLRLLSMSNRTFYEVYIFRVMAHRQLKEYEKAIELAEFVIELQPDREDGHVLLAEIYKEMGELEKSEEQYRMAEEINPALKRRGE